MPDFGIYVPILKAKDGEFGALACMDPTLKPLFTPLIDVPPVPYVLREVVLEDGTKTQRMVRITVDEHVCLLGAKLKAAWGTDSPLWLDLGSDPGSEPLANGQPAIDFVLTDARKRGVQVIPVTDLRRDAAYQAAVQAAVRLDGRGVCIRLSQEDMASGNALGKSLDSLLEYLGVPASETDLVLDFRDIIPGQAATIALAAKAVINTLPRLQEWRTLTFAASAFPANLSDYGPDSINLRERTEWLVWNKLREQQEKLGRLPTFGDYGVQHPDFAETIDPRILQMSANIRYTSTNTWVIVKGKSVKRHGGKQYNDLCRRLVQRPEFCGRGYSWGDTYIADWHTPERQKKPGNATTWRQVGTSHHLTFVLRQLSNPSVT